MPITTCTSWHQWPEAWPDPWPTSLITRNDLPFAAVCTVCRPFVDPIAYWQWNLYSSKYWNENSSMQDHRNKGRTLRTQQSINQPRETSSRIFLAWSFCNFVSAKPAEIWSYRYPPTVCRSYCILWRLLPFPMPTNRSGPDNSLLGFWRVPFCPRCSSLRGSWAFSRHQNSFRAQPPSQVHSQWRPANKNREEQQCWPKNQ